MATMFFHGRLGLHVVDRIEDESASRREDLASAQHLLADLCRRSEGENLLRVHAAAPEHDLFAECCFQLFASMPVAEHCTGLRMSIPASRNDGMNFDTAPQECLKIFHDVCAWIQSQSCL